MRELIYSWVMAARGTRVQIYKGKPILYNLGDFIFQNETLLRLPIENYETYALGALSNVNDFNDARYNFDKTGFPADRMIWEAMVAVPRFREEQLTSWHCTPSRWGWRIAQQSRPAENGRG